VLERLVALAGVLHPCLHLPLAKVLRQKGDTAGVVQLLEVVFNGHFSRGEAAAGMEGAGGGQCEEGAGTWHSAATRLLTWSMTKVGGQIPQQVMCAEYNTF